MATLQYAVAIRNGQLDQVESVTGTLPIFRFYSGTLPATTATVASGTLLAQGSLPSDWMAAASGGSKAKSGTWTITGVAGAGTGTAIGYFRILDSGDTTTYIQGDVTVTGGGGAMTVDNTSIANLQVATVNTFTLTAGNA